MRDRTHEDRAAAKAVGDLLLILDTRVPVENLPASDRRTIADARDIADRGER